MKSPTNELRYNKAYALRQSVIERLERQRETGEITDAQYYKRRYSANMYAAKRAKAL